MMFHYAEVGVNTPSSQCIYHNDGFIVLDDCASTIVCHCSYPMQPPVVRFVTKVFHPNISRHGDVGLDSIHHNWSLALTISKVLLSIQSLLTDPFWYVCMEPAIGQLYRNNVHEFNRIARLWTWKYAMHDYLKPLSDSIIPNTVHTL